LINRRSQAFKKTNPALDDLNEEEIIALIHSNPRIMVRPIIVGPKVFLTGFKVGDYESQL